MTNKSVDYAKISLTQPESENDPFTVERYRQFARFLPSGALSVLDVGCNTGRGGAEMKRLNPSLIVSGLDCVSQRLEKLPGCYAAKLCGVSTDIPAAAESFDAVVAGEFVEHLAPMDVDPTLAEFFRVLKVGGRLLLTTPNPSSLVSKLLRRGVLGGPHLSQHHADCLRLRLRMTGFSHVKIYGSGKSSRYLGMRVPFRFFYGSYLVSALKQ